MDEPTSSLQGAVVDRLFALIRRLAARGIAIVYISHFLEEVRQIAHRYTVLRDGRSVGSGAIAGTTNDQLITMMVGRSAEGLFPTRHPPRDPTVVLSVRGVAAPPRLREASFDLRAGEIFGIAGLLGSGRTELVRALYGLDNAAAGTVELHGTARPARDTAPADRVRQGVGYVSEDRKGEGLALPLSIADNLCATRPQRSRAGMIDLTRQTERTRHWIRELRVRAHSASQAVRSLSGGNQQKVAIARLLHADVDVLLLDEPTRGIDVGSKAQIYQLIDDLAAGDPKTGRAPKAILMISSYLPELLGTCDEIAVMTRGRLGAARPVGEWDEHQLMQAAIGKEELQSA
jgi:ribose transport system ATP-binding protein